VTFLFDMNNEIWVLYAMNCCRKESICLHLFTLWWSPFKFNEEELHNMNVHIVKSRLGTKNELLF
jgi:hypothetical protein